jgi:hypothetical protein
VNVAGSLIGLYPAAFRERWGANLLEEAEAAGWAGWLDLAAGLVDAWLHPAIWPASSAPQRHRRAGQLAIALALFGWFVVHLEAELDDRLAAWPARTGLVDACALLLGAGLLLVAPWPRPSLATAAVLLRRAIQLLAGPAVLGLGVAVAVNWFGVDVGSPGWVKVLGLGCWWTALAWASIQAGRIVPGLEAGLVVPPTAVRLRLGLGFLGVAVAGTGAVVLGSAVGGHGVDPLLTAGGIALLALTWLVRGTYWDLAQE